MKGITLVLAFLLSTLSYADTTTIDVGLWTYHEKRADERDGECFNETHRLVAIYKYNVGVGHYLNTHCKMAYFIGYQHKLYKELTLDVAAVSGYPEDMHIVDKLIIIPALTYRYYVGDVGIKFLVVPPEQIKKKFTLVGVGFSIKL